MGLGFRFLEHTLQSKILLFLIDINGFQLQFRLVIFHPMNFLQIFHPTEMSLFSTN
jgi:GTPase involved in cell partitioning and DNA repair